MTKTALKKKIIEYVENGDDKILRAVYTILEEHNRVRQEASLLNEEQKAELDRRMKLFEAGKMEVYDWQEIYKKKKSKYKK